MDDSAAAAVSVHNGTDYARPGQMSFDERTKTCHFSSAKLRAPLDENGA